MPAPKKIIDEDKVIAELGDLKYKKGYGNVKLVEHLKEHYNIGLTKSYQLINEMNVKVGEIYNNIYDDSLRDSIAFMENLRSKALLDGNGKLALEIQKELNKINQLHIQKLDITSGGDKININIIGS